MKLLFFLVSRTAYIWIFTLVLCQISYARTFEMMGSVHYVIPQLSPNPNSFSKSTNAVGYGFSGRLELGPGQVESGFQYVPVGFMSNHSFGKVETTAGYWTFPILYRFYLFEPFFSIAGGLDYALVGNTRINSTSTNANDLTSGFVSHFGYVFNFEAKQDVGNNLSLVLDFRFRQGLAPAITFDRTSSTLRWFAIGIGIQKLLETGF